MRFIPLAALLLLLVTIARGEDPATFPVGAFTFARPTTWSWVPVTSPMRKAELKVPGADASQFGDITFFHFGAGQGGDIQANTQRWLRQFDSKPGTEKTASLDAGSTKITLVTTEGTFHSGMPGGPTTSVPDQALLGAILENPEGNVFVKMTGPIALVNATRQQFIDFVTAAAATAKK